MKKSTSILALIALLFTTQLTIAQINPGQLGGKELNTITTAVPFLQIAPDSRAGALADIGCATSADVNSQAYNPSKYVFSKNTFGISVSYSPWLHNLVNDINLAYLSAYWKITEMDAIAMSIRYFSLGDIEFTALDGSSLGSRNPNEFAIDFSYSRKLIDQLSIAVTPRFVYSNLTGGMGVDGQPNTVKAGLAGAADISLFYEQDFKAKKLYSSTLRAGLCISNIGNKMSYSSGTQRRDFLPTNLKLGVGYELGIDEYNKIAFTGEINKLLVPTNPVYLEDSVTLGPVFDDNGNRIIAYGKDPDVSVAQGMIQSFYDAPGVGYGRNGMSPFLEEMAEISWALGVEYSYRDLFFVRAGYFHENQYKGNRQFATVGAGIKYNIFNIDVAYLFCTNGQQHPLANTLRFTLTFDFVSFNRDAIKRQGKLN